MKVGIYSTSQNYDPDSGEKGTYSSDTDFLGDVGGGIDIDLVELDGWELV